MSSEPEERPDKCKIYIGRSGEKIEDEARELIFIIADAISNGRQYKEIESNSECMVVLSTKDRQHARDIYNDLRDFEFLARIETIK